MSVLLNIVDCYEKICQFNIDLQFFFSLDFFLWFVRGEREDKSMATHPHDLFAYVRTRIAEKIVERKMIKR